MGNLLNLGENTYMNKSDVGKIVYHRKHPDCEFVFCGFEDEDMVMSPYSDEAKRVHNGELLTY